MADDWVAATAALPAAMRCSRRLLWLLLRLMRAICRLNPPTALEIDLGALPAKYFAAAKCSMAMLTPCPTIAAAVKA